MLNRYCIVRCQWDEHMPPNVLPRAWFCQMNKGQFLSFWPSNWDDELKTECNDEIIRIIFTLNQFRFRSEHEKRSKKFYGVRNWRTAHRISFQNVVCFFCCWMNLSWFSFFHFEWRATTLLYRCWNVRFICITVAIILVMGSYGFAWDKCSISCRAYFRWFLVHRGSDARSNKQ